MNHEEYFNEKLKFAYNLEKNGKFFSKARAIIIRNGKLLAIKMVYKDGRPCKYLLPGGGVDSGETPKQAAIREAYEEYGAVTKMNRYFGKKYYNTEQNYKGENFISHRVEFYYILDCLEIENNVFGLEGEFDLDDKTFEKVELSLEELIKLNYNAIAGFNEKIFNNLIKYMKNS